MVAAGALALGAAPAHGQTPSTSQSAPRTILRASFSPDRLGAATAIAFSIRLDPPTAGDPLPVNAVNVSYPRNLGIATSGLGLEACAPALLEDGAAQACPADSKLGQGAALVEVPFGPSIVQETVALQIYAVPSSDGYLQLAILAEGNQPVIASVVLPGMLLPGALQITVPPIESLPGAPNAALISMHATLGGALTYYEHADGHTVAYRPRGIGLPDSCPRGGFKLGVTVDFADGQRSRGQAAVPCPRRRR